MMKTRIGSAFMQRYEKGIKQLRGINVRLDIVWEVHLAKPGELGSKQRGYATNAKGECIASTKPGAWRPEWQVIGTDGMGDPYFIDQSKPEWPVLTAAHGMGAWNPTPVSPTFDAFIQTMEIIETMESELKSARTYSAVRALTNNLPKWKSDLKGINGSGRNSGYERTWKKLLDEALKEHLQDKAEDLRPPTRWGAYVKSVQQYAAKRCYPKTKKFKQLNDIIFGPSSDKSKKGTLIVTGPVESDQALKLLENIVKEINPPYTVYWYIFVKEGGAKRLHEATWQYTT